jgi:hypothetical protein
MIPLHTMEAHGAREGIAPTHSQPWHEMGVSRGSSGSIVSDYGPNDRGSIPDRGREFFF